MQLIIKNGRTRKLLLIGISLLAFLIIAASASFAHEDEAEHYELPPGLQKLQEYQDSLASSVTLLLALFAGIITMTSPCGIALLPAFFSVGFKDRKKSVLMATAFSIGLLAAFVIFGIVAGIMGDFFNKYKLGFAGFSGYALIIFGIIMAMNIELGFLNFKIDYSKRKSFFSSSALGFFFGIGWTPFVGPVVLGMTLLAANSATTINGVIMMLSYGIGMVIPLILLSYFADRFSLSESKFFKGKIISFNLLGKKIITHTYNLIGGLILLAIGITTVYYQGTFFFQVDLPKIIPWSMYFWGYLNEWALESKLFTTSIGNVIGGLIAAFILIVVLRIIIRNKNGGNEST